jgi:hypothetical protein
LIWQHWCHRQAKDRPQQLVLVRAADAARAEISACRLITADEVKAVASEPYRASAPAAEMRGFTGNVDNSP